MADEFDRAQDAEEQIREIAIAEHRAKARARPRDDCADCDEPLPEHRRQYGTCVGCQTIREQRARHLRKE